MAMTLMDLEAVMAVGVTAEMVRAAPPMVAQPGQTEIPQQFHFQHSLLVLFASGKVNEGGEGDAGGVGGSGCMLLLAKGVKNGKLKCTGFVPTAVVAVGLVNDSNDGEAPGWGGCR
jgi:hypothetical protein